MSRESTITECEDVSYVSSPHIPRTLRRPGGPSLSSNAHRAHESAGKVSTIRDDLDEVITLSNVTILVGEWLPFGANQIVELNIKLGANERCQGGYFTSTVDQNSTATQFEVPTGLTQVRIVDYDLTRFTNIEAEVYFPEEPGVVQIECFGIHARLDGTLVPSQSTRYEAGQTVAYDKEGVRSTQILGGNDYDKAPRLTEYVVSLTAALSSVAGQVRPLSPSRQTNKLAVCDAIGASYPKHIDNGGGDDPRLLTAILYLSGDVDGGRFRSYKATEDVVTAEVAPAPGTFVCFWSDRLVHDVSEVTRLDEARWALTVWLCTDDDVVEATPDEVLAAHWPHLRDS